MSRCDCGAAVEIQKSSECLRCYHRRYYGEKRHARLALARDAASERMVSARSETVAALPADVIEAAARAIAEATRERRRAVRRAEAAVRRLEDRAMVLLHKRSYRERNRDEIRAKDADYRARPEIAHRRREAARARYATPEGRLASRERDRARRGLEARIKWMAAWRDSPAGKESARRSSVNYRARKRAEREAAGWMPSPNHNATKTRCKQGHEFTPDNTYTRPGTTFRECRACRRAYKNKGVSASVTVVTRQLN